MHRSFTQSILMLILLMLSPAGVALAQNADAPVEPPATLPAASDADSAATAEDAPKAELAKQAARARAIAKLFMQLKPLLTPDVTDIELHVEDAWPDLLTAMATDPATRPMKVIATNSPNDAVIVSRDDVTRWIEQAEKSPRAAAALKDTTIDDLALAEPLSVSVRRNVPEALQLAPLVTDDAKKVPEPPLWKKHVVGQGRLLAERAARADALQRLAWRAREIAVNDSLTVESFIANSDQPDVDVRQFLRGAKTLGLRCREDALIFEVVLQGSRRTMLASFTGWADSHYKGKPADLVALRKAVEEGIERLFPETGSAMPPKETIRGLEPEALVRLQAVTGEAVPMWATAEYRAQADGTTPVSADLERQALAKLLEQAWTAKLSGGEAEQTLGNLAAENETVLHALVLAALLREQDVKRDPVVNEMTVRATMPMLPAWRIIARHVLDEGLLPGMKP